MRVDRIGPRTWLLATIAAWSLACWLLALAGLGAQARVLADDATLLPPLPAAPAAATQRLKPLAQYREAIARPLFASDRRPHPFVLDTAADDAGERGDASFDYVLTSVLIAPPLRMAILQPQGGGEGIRVRLGAAADEIPGWRLVELAPRSAVFEGPGGRRTLPLRTFDGTGGEAPSQVPGAAARQRAIEAAAAEEAEAAAGAAAAATDAGGARRAIEPAPAPTQVQTQAEAIRKRIEARRAQMRRDAAQSTAPARKPVESDP